MKLISWNLLHKEGAAVADVAALIQQQTPDLLLMQEATEDFAALTTLVGGVFVREPLPGRRHGLAMWAPKAAPRPPVTSALPSGPMVRRVFQLVDTGPFAIANVHLSHGQVLNRRQLRHIAQHLAHHGAIIGDFNMVGPTLLPGFRDVGPRAKTHRMSKLVPLRLDRCLTRALTCTHAEVLSRGASDHHPILLMLAVP